MKKSLYTVFVSHLSNERLCCCPVSKRVLINTLGQTLAAQKHPLSLHIGPLVLSPKLFEIIVNVNIPCVWDTATALTLKCRDNKWPLGYFLPGIALFNTQSDKADKTTLLSNKHTSSP